MNKIFRIVDVNFNRAREGLRVLEETIRFIYNKEDVLRKIRDIRHKLSTKILYYFPSEKLKSQRDTKTDFGKRFNEKQKLNLKEIIETNFFRVEESMRVLEEYSKVIKPELSSIFHQLRFEIYEIEKEVITKIHRKKIKPPSLYVILNLKENEKEFLKFSESVIKEKPDLIQLRYKGENIKFFLKMAKYLKKIIPDEIIYIINDRVDISILCESDGLHIGQNDLEVEEVRKIIPEKIIGVSTSKILDVKKLKNKDIDYVAIGSIFKSKTKPEKKPIGTGIFKDLKKYITIPIIGIGGINIENAKEVIEKGADGIAVINVVESSNRPEEVIKKLKEEIKKGWNQRIKRGI